MIPFTPRSRRFLGTFVVLVSLAGWAAESRVDAGILDDIYAEQNIQRQLPVAASPTPTSAGGFGIPTAFAWGLLGAAVVGITALALWLAGFGLDTAANPRGPSPGQPGVAPQRAEAERPVPADWLGVADDLARRGRFGEAIHLLLLGVLGTLRKDAPTSRATTAREIARTTVGPHRERLQALVRASELAHFGGRSATRAEFEACRRDAAEMDRAIAPSHA